MHPNSLANLKPVRRGEIRNVHGRAGASGVTVRTIRELARERHDLTGESKGEAVSRIYYSIALDGMIEYADGTVERVGVRDRLRALEVIADRLDPKPKDEAQASRDRSEADAYRRMLAQEAEEAMMENLPSRPDSDEF